MAYTITNRGNMPNGDDICVEDWSKVYPNLSEQFTVSVYPKSRYTLPGDFSPKAGETFRCGFTFQTIKAAQSVFDALTRGQAQLENYVEYLENPRYKPCVIGHN